MTGWWLAVSGWLVAQPTGPAVPSIDEAVLAAFRLAGLEAQAADGTWVRRGRLRALFPVAQGRAATDLDWSLRALDDLREDRAVVAEIRLRWDLRDLMFHPSEVAAQRERRAWLLARQRLRAQVIRAYEAWLAARERARIDPQHGAAVRIKAQVLTGWTGLSFPAPPY